jgi:fibronectin type 3 domain-containing protein
MFLSGEHILQPKFFARFLLSLVVCIVCGSVANGQVNITTWQGSLQHTGLNSSETTLTPAVVGSPGNFGLLFTQQTDGQTYGQPLYVSSSTLGQFANGSTHNVVYIATQAGSLYAFDADSDPLGSNSNGTDSAPLWHASLIPSGCQPITQNDVASTDILGDLAVTTTPVIDTTSSTIYIVSTIINPTVTPSYQQLLYALDLKTGVPKFGSPVVVNASFSGTPVTPSSTDKDPVTSPGPGLIPFAPLHEHLRAAMILYHGVVYLTYASHSDEQPYYGEILGYDATTLQQVSTFITTPNDVGGEAGIWQSGAGPAIDESGNMYVVTGNGAFDQNASSFNTATDWGESVFRLPTNTTGAIPLSFSDTTSWFTPSNWAQLNSGNDDVTPNLPGDRDLGSGGMLLLPDQTQGSHTHIMVGGGKAGVLYVLDRDSLGGINANDSSAIQEILEPSGTSLFVTPAYFNGNIYYAPDGGSLEQRQVQYDATTGDYVSPTAITSTVNAPFKGAGVFISSNATNNGIVWTLGNALTAYDATNVTNPIFNATTNVPGVGGQCTTAKFSLPIEANGKVYYSCFNASTNIGYLFVSGLFPAAMGTPAAPTGLTAMANSSSQITLSWTNDATNQSGFTINRSTSSTGPFSLAGTVSAETTTFTDIGLNPATTYYYQVLATNANGSSLASNLASASTFPSYTPTGLVAYWNMDDGSDLPNVFDVTGNGNLGTSLGEAGPTAAGYINGAWIFHGTSSVDRIDVPNNSSLQFGVSQSFTLSAWLNAAALTGKEQAIIAKSADQGNEYGIWINAANKWVGRGPGGDLVGPTAVVDTWTNVALVQDGVAGTRSLYINGVLQATGPAQAADGAGDLWMGEQNIASTVEGYQGEIDEVRLYNVALTPDAVNDTLSPPILDAVSNQTHGSAGSFGITLFPAPAPQVEPRVGTTSGTYNLVLHFAAPVAGITATLGVQAGVTQSAVGQVASVTYDSTNTVVTVVLTGVQNAQALNLHLAGVIPAPVTGNGVVGIPGTADLPFDILQGDVSGDHVVDQYDLTQVEASFTPQVTQSTFLYDINCDGAVNQTDANLISSLSGTSLTVQTDTNLAFFKPATASSVTGNMTAAMAFDNNVNTRWDSVEGSTADPSWIQVNLGHIANIHSISINWNAEAADYTLQGSNDPDNWPDTSTIQTVTGNTSGAGTVTFSGLNATGQYVRMYGTQRATNYGYSINEFEIVGSFVPSSSTAPSISSSLTAAGTVGTAFSYQIAASQSPTSFGASGLPGVLTVNTAGLISGTPTTAGTSAVTITATNSAGTGSATLTLTISAAVAAPQPPAGLTATAGSSQVTLNWTASAGATSYSVFRGTASGAEATTPIASGLTGTSFVDTGVANGTAYFYFVEAVNTAGSSTPSSEVSATPAAAVVIPSAPTSLTATAGNAQVILSWIASTGATSYTIYRGTSSGAESSTPIASGVTATTYTDTSLSNGVTYFYTVAAVNSAGTSASSNEASATPQLPTASTAIYQINSGGSAVAPFVADEFFNTGATSATNSTIATTGVTNAAPMAVYQTDRYGGAFTYTLPGLTSGASYIVHLHFVETYWTAAGQRLFNVAINGKSVLTNFDILATAGGPDIAVVEPFTVNANSSGQIIIAFTSGTADLPKINGIEILSSGSMMPIPATATGLTATSGDSQVALTWTPGNGPTGSYSIFRGTTSGGEASTPIATGLTATHFIDTTVTNLTTYYYTVTATNGAGTSGASNEVSAEPGAPVTGTAIYQVNAGGNAIAPYVADEFSTGGGEAGTGNSISTSAVVSPAPQAVYQTERNGGSFTYVFPDLNPGTSYLVRLHFAEFYWTLPGQRVFNVSINGTPVLQNFDIVATAGAPNTALVEQFTAVADANGDITVAYFAGTADQPKASAIEIYP